MVVPVPSIAGARLGPGLGEGTVGSGGSGLPEIKLLKQPKSLNSGWSRAVGDRDLCSSERLDEDKLGAAARESASGGRRCQEGLPLWGLQNRCRGLRLL